MPFVPAATEKCAKCDKSVYAAEERVANGHKYHKGCFKCSMCSKFLESTNCNEHDKELFCKNCYGRKYGPKGYGFGGGAGALCMDDGSHLKSQ
ncbi:muscle LIM protein 1-like isoform X2 [Contarinia nasturtii]|uniref:muscle LIM protein 1-like isoform X2 n=1 Tax=Contarinia nasturtii TaxID=265458 RepID=UPI0012D42A0F|nr:muscle LIM protein 1-like isoform X2 [Contarinia nasturtii]